VHVADRPPVELASPSTDRRAPRLPDGCRTPSLDPDELRRCALATVLGPTGGLRAEVPLAGLLTLAVGAMLAMRRPRASTTLA